MESDNGKIWYSVGIDNTQLQADANKTKATFKGITATATEEGNKMQNSFSGIGAGLAAMGGMAAIGMLGKQILDTTAKFEKFGIVLKNTLGDTAGADALVMIAEFAATTPFQLDEVTGAFIKLANQGFVPTKTELTKLGDLASSTGKSFDQLGEALLDAQTGQFERLKEFGIKASASGDKVTFSFKEQKTTVENTNSAIQAYILSLGTLKGVAGANALISASLTGQLSNLADKMAAMYNEIGTGNKGLLYGIVGGASTLIENYKTVGEAVKALIAVFGAYKLAVMYVNWENKTAAATQLLCAQSTTIQSLAEARSIVIKGQLNAAQKALNASMLANPYVLAAMAITALGYALYKVVTYQTDLEKQVESTNQKIEEETGKTDALFYSVQKAAIGTEEYKTAKEAILSQYGQYIPALAKEKDGLDFIALSQESVNKAIRDNLLLKGQQDQKAKIDKAASSTLSSAKSNIAGGVDINKQDMAGVLVEDYISSRISGGKNQDETDKLIKNLMDIGASSAIARGQVQKLISAIDGQKQATKELNEAFPIAEIEAGKTIKKTELTTYAAQRKVIEDQKKKLEAELAAAKATPGVDPTKKVVEIQGKIDAINKQLGEKATKEKLTQIEVVKKAMETAHGQDLYRLTQKLKKLEEIKRIEEEIASGSKMKGVTDSGANQATAIVAEFSSAIEPLAKKKDAINKKEISDAEAKMAKSDEAYQKDKDHQQWLHEQKLKDLEKERAIQEANADILYQIADAFGSIAGSIGDSNRGLADMMKGLGAIAGELGNLTRAGAFSKDGMSQKDAIGASISGATQLIGLVVSQAAANKQVMKEYYSNIISQQQDYNLLLNEQLRLNSDINKSVFLKDYKGRLESGASAFNNAQKEYNDELKKFAQSEAITGQKNVVSGKNVLGGVGAGAALGAGIGTLIAPGIGTIIGAGAGAVVGFFTGLFAKKKKDIVAPLLETYKDLIGANGEFNADLAKTLITNKQVTEETAKTLQKLIDWKDAADKAREQLTGVIIELAGGLGDDLRNALVDAFKAGTDASKAFGDSVNKTLENIMSNMLFNKVFEGSITKLGEDMNASYGIGPDGKPTTGAVVDQSWTDDLQRFYQKAPELVKQFNQAMSDAQKEAGAAGFSVFGKDQAAADRTATSKGLAAMSQDTGNELNGRFTAIQGHTFSISETIKIMAANSSATLKHLAGIESNTEYCRRLEAIEGDMKATRVNLDTVVLKGITLKQ